MNNQNHQCRNCGSDVSIHITICPACGASNWIDAGAQGTTPPPNEGTS